jgi:hypothetical protein
MSTYLDRAFTTVQAELRDAGLGNLVLWVDIDYSWDPRDHAAWGWYGAAPHTITIPRFAVTISNHWQRLRALLGLERSRMHSLRDVIRHEYGHALRDSLGDYDRVSTLWGQSPCISDYAAGQPTAKDRADEDFAETFMLFLKFSGTWRGSWPDPLIRRKWTAMGRAITAAHKVRLTGTFTCPGRGCKTLLDATSGSMVSCPDCGRDIDLR